MRFGLIIAGALFAAASGTAASAQTTVELPSHMARVTPEQRAAGERWMAARGIQYQIAYDAERRIAFRFGGVTHNLTEAEFLSAFQRVLGDSTIAVTQRVSLNNDRDASLAEVSYFEKRGEHDGFLYTWPIGHSQVLKLSYSLRALTSDERARGFVGGLMCVDRGRGTPKLCSSVYDMLMGYHGRHAGDPLGLRNQTIPANLTLTSAWPDETPMIPEHAPQDAALLGHPQ